MLLDIKEQDIDELKYQREYMIIKFGWINCVQRLDFMEISDILTRKIAEENKYIGPGHIRKWGRKFDIEQELMEELFPSDRHIITLRN